MSGLPPEILLVPLIGHRLPHAGVAVYAQGKWLFHAGDAYYYRGEISPTSPCCPLGLMLVQRLGAIDNQALSWNQERLRHLRLEHTREVSIFSAHNPIEFERFSSR